MIKTNKIFPYATQALTFKSHSSPNLPPLDDAYLNQFLNMDAFEKNEDSGDPLACNPKSIVPSAPDIQDAKPSRPELLPSPDNDSFDSTKPDQPSSKPQSEASLRYSEPADNLQIPNETFNPQARSPENPFFYSSPWASNNLDLFSQIEVRAHAFEAKNPDLFSKSNFLLEGLVGEPERLLAQKDSEIITIDNKWKLKTIPDRRDKYRFTNIQTKKSVLLNKDQFIMFKRCLDNETVRFDVSYLRPSPIPSEMETIEALRKKLEKVQAGNLIYKSEIQQFTSYFIPSL